VRKIAVAAGLAVGISVLSVDFAGGAKEAKEHPPGHGASDLKAVVADLTKKITALEKRIEKLEAGQQTIVISPTMAPEVKVLPKGWQRREFNGMPYYIVPLDKKQSKR